MEEIVKHFLKFRGIDLRIDLNPQIIEAIGFLEKSNQLALTLVANNQTLLQEQPSWPCMHDMYNRSYEYTCGALTCFLTAQIASAEALCRTAIEGAVNLHYVSLGDSLKNQIAYFKEHISNERKQNKNWKKSVQESQSSKEAKDHHYEKIDLKEEALDTYEQMLVESLALVNVDYNSENSSWPSIFDRFRAIGEEIGYRTIYAALCSQAHNDAEDILNNMMARVTITSQNLELGNLTQLYRFSLYMVYSAIRYHVLATAMYIAKFEIKVTKLIELHCEILSATQQITEETPDLIRKNMKL